VIKKNKLFILLIALGVIIRLLLMVSTYHSDLAGQIISSYFFAYKNVINIYDFLANMPADQTLIRNFGLSDIFIYPPLTYFTLGGWLKLIQPLTSEKFFLDVMSGISVYKIPNFNYYLFILKLPYLIVDLLMAFSLTKLFDKNSDKKLVALLWLFNPVTLYASFSMGVFDIIPALFTVLSLVFLKKNRVLMAALMLGFGAAYKSYPLFLLPLLVLSQRSIWSKIKTAFIGALPFVASNLPFWSSAAYKYMVFGPKSQKQFFMIWLVSGGEGIFPYLLGFVILCLIASRDKNSAKKMYAYFLAFFLLLFSVTNYHPQWFIWIAPFFVIELVMNRLRNIWLTLILFGCYVAIVLLFENSLSAGLFAPVWPDLNNFPGFAKIISAKTDLGFFKSGIRSLFAGISLYLSYDILNLKEKDNS